MGWYLYWYFLLSPIYLTVYVHIPFPFSLTLTHGEPVPGPLHPALQVADPASEEDVLALARSRVLRLLQEVLGASATGTSARGKQSWKGREA